MTFSASGSLPVSDSTFIGESFRPTRPERTLPTQIFPWRSGYRVVTERGILAPDCASCLSRGTIL